MLSRNSKITKIIEKVQKAKTGHYSFILRFRGSLKSRRPLHFQDLIIYLELCLRNVFLLLCCLCPVFRFNPFHLKTSSFMLSPAPRCWSPPIRPIAVPFAPTWSHQSATLSYARRRTTQSGPACVVFAAFTRRLNFLPPERSQHEYPC